jgi:hypothetical protein
MSEFDSRLQADSAVLQRAQSINANPAFILDFVMCAIFLVIGILTLVLTSYRDNDPMTATLETHGYPWVGWAVFAAIVIGTVIVQRVPNGENVPIAIAVILSIIVGFVAVYVAHLPGWVTLAVVALGAVLTLATPNGGNFMLMGMAVLSLGAGLVTLWAAALAMFGAAD